MSPSESTDTLAHPSAAEINAQLRAYAAGRVVWTEHARAEWRRLTAEWTAAADQQMAGAA